MAASNRMTAFALAASVPPLATVPFERWAYHRLVRAQAQMDASAPPRSVV